MKIVYVLIQTVIAEIKQCCFDDWTEWQQSSLTCGQICYHRTRNNIDSDDDFWGAAGSWLGNTFAGTNSCNKIYSSCPTYESQDDSCVDKACREFRNHFVSTKFLMPFSSYFLSFHLTEFHFQRN